MQPRQQRYRIRLSTLVIMRDKQDQGKMLLFYTENLSLSGALIKYAYESLDLRFNQGELVDITLQLPAIDSGDHEIRCGAQIVRNPAEDRLGIKFDLDEQAHRRLRAYLAKFVAEFPESII